ncbi:EAL domain-containing protein [Desulfovibrio sp. OttesenSCG-928-O18]|nr:EAL domain-containing protein [Desulfovibrio sp. OttesenSCG-928-O18]
MHYDRKTLRLTDLLDLGYLQELQDAFAASTGVTTTIVDPDGDRITRPSNWRGLCAIFYDIQRGEETCRSITNALVRRCRATGRPEFAECPHGGITTAAVPIFVNGTFLGCWLFGQMRVQDPPSSTLKKTASRTGVNLRMIEEAFSLLPRFSQESFELTLAFMRTLTGTLAELSKKNLEMMHRDKELRAVTQELTFRDRMLTQFVHTSPSAMYISDYRTGRIIMVNQALSDLTGLPAEAMLGGKCREILGAALEGFCDSCPLDSLLSAEGQPGEAQILNYNCPNRELWLLRTHRAFTWNVGRKVHMAAIEDVTHKQILHQQLEFMAFNHRRTGLLNAHSLAKIFEEDLSVNNKPERFMICFDISSLRLFSDAYGRETGDEMLKVIAAWLLDEDFGESTAYHLGGHEFCLLLRNADEARAEAVAAKISTRFEAPWQVNISGHDISYLCGASVAILHIPPDIVEYRALMDLISRTFSSARAATGIFVYNEEADRQNREHIKLVLELKKCVNNGMQGFSLQFQPIVQISTGTWKGLEALCRWTMPGGGPVSPLVFIHEAESLGLINCIGMWVLENAVKQAKALALDSVSGFFISVNISPIQMMDETFADTVAAILERYRYPGSKLNLEVTESARMTFSNFTMSMIEKLRAMGVSLALDDFGTGYSSFNNLKHLPVNFLKTERDFILGIENDTYMQYFFYIMSEIAHANKMKLIAEGVESAEQLRIVKNNGADYIQGYFFSKPLSPEELERQVARFVCPDHWYVPETVEVVNIKQWLSGKSAYELTPTLFTLMNQCMQILLAETDEPEAFHNVFEIVGQHFGVSRAFAFVEVEGGLFSNLYEWCGEGVASQKHLLQRIPIIQHTPSLLEAFKADGMIIASDIQNLTKDMQTALKGQDVMAIALLPMWEEDRLTGFVGFDRTVPYAWSPEEIVMLWNLAMLLASTCKREKLKSEVVEKRSILDTVLQNSGLNAYVTDVETNELLWVNESMQKLHKLGPGSIGRKCYAVLAQRKDRCPHCKVPELLRDPLQGQIAHEVHNEQMNRDFMAYASLIRWAGNKTAHIHYSMDVTDQRNTQKQLEYLASTDMLTGAFNRTTIVGKFQRLLQQAQESGIPLSVCFINVNQLKKINDEYGHDIGDQTLFHTVQAINSCTLAPDIIGRVSGDEFIVLMPGCGKGVAKLRMMQAQYSLAQVKVLRCGKAVSFRFGIAENTELPYADNATYYSELLGLAEKRMQEQQ